MRAQKISGEENVSSQIGHLFFPILMHRLSEALMSHYSSFPVVDLSVNKDQKALSLHLSLKFLFILHTGASNLMSSLT